MTLRLVFRDSAIKSSKMPALSREDGKKFLDSIVNSARRKVERSPVQAVLNSNWEEAATPAQRERIPKAQAVIRAGGKLFIVDRNSDGTLSTADGPPLPETNVPDSVRANLTREDWNSRPLSGSLQASLASIGLLPAPARRSAAAPCSPLTRGSGVCRTGLEIGGVRLCRRARCNGRSARDPTSYFRNRRHRRDRFKHRPIGGYGSR